MEPLGYVIIGALALNALGFLFVGFVSKGRRTVERKEEISEQEDVERKDDDKTFPLEVNEGDEHGSFEQYEEVTEDLVPESEPEPVMPKHRREVFYTSRLLDEKNEGGDSADATDSFTDETIELSQYEPYKYSGNESDQKGIEQYDVDERLEYLLQRLKEEKKERHVDLEEEFQ
ncbi:hypothetical protein IMZ31_21315 (plasmid) [Pontibacillus sp. ALD_SL1]|uniref:hypothetical protein n=1 Tax=Pontibacillus sp. ALD_SL1 TaxID=2777185 RepID=UPI001A96B384|nr:hypothetical protein [Pontibacillus sp. ALD_SL1]QST03091.1 hypothetical protein IMZ31_21315 [Pontibacillus sp. ALD_SL1]